MIEEHGMNWWERLWLPAIIIGLVRTMGHLLGAMLRNTYTTVEWPEEKKPVYPRFRGAHHLEVDPDGVMRCVACEMCATACPAECITITAGEWPDPARKERYPVTFIIDELRCIYCGFCVEACPEDAISMTNNLELADYTRENLIYDRDYLMRNKG